jgi:hypothetical protein
MVHNSKGKIETMCDKLRIHRHFFNPYYPQPNEQIETINKTLKSILKRRLDMVKGLWVNELPQILQSYHTTTKIATGENPFSLAYRMDAMMPVKIDVSLPRD